MKVRAYEAPRRVRILDILQAVLLGCAAAVALDILLNCRVYTNPSEWPRGDSEESKAKLLLLRQKMYGADKWAPTRFLPTVSSDSSLSLSLPLPLSIKLADSDLDSDSGPGPGVGASAGAGPSASAKKLLKYLQHNHFPRFDVNSSAVPTWILTQADKSSVHRFFDSSPLSPSGRYIAYTQLPDVFRDRQPEGAGVGVAPALVVVLDLRTAKETVVASTTAYGAQLGAQVQWGVTDAELFYNAAYASSGDTKASSAATGVIFNQFTETHVRLQCPIYHLSTDGKYSVTPNLERVKDTQYGYGADYTTCSGSSVGSSDSSSDSSSGSSNSSGSSGTRNLQGVSSQKDGGRSDCGRSGDGDGIYVTDVKAGKCQKVFTLQSLAKLINLNLDDDDLYGFHTKWSPDSKYLLVVMRSLSLPNRYYTLHQWIHNTPKVRRQHLFAVKVPYHNNNNDGEGARESDSDNSNTDSNRMIDFSGCWLAKHVVTWSSKEFYNKIDRKQHTDTYDGNHPNWVQNYFTGSRTMKGRTQQVHRNVHRISMNRQKASVEINDGGTIGGGGGDDDDSTIRWEVVVYDIDKLFASEHGLLFGGTAKAQVDSEAVAELVYSRGSGHPTVYTDAYGGNGLMLTDSYAKEAAVFNSRAMLTAFPYAAASTAFSSSERDEGGAKAVQVVVAPLRLVDTRTAEEVWLLAMPLTPFGAGAGAGTTHETSHSESMIGRSVDFMAKGELTSKRHLRAWRCDMHPVRCGPRGEWVVFNGRPKGRHRQVMLAYLGSKWEEEYFGADDAGSVSGSERNMQR
eukprot:GSChrysophyteH2.ASY1.ANO1.181.1 assembled CDS